MSIDFLVALLVRSKKKMKKGKFGISHGACLRQSIIVFRVYSSHIDLFLSLIIHRMLLNSVLNVQLGFA